MMVESETYSQLNIRCSKEPTAQMVVGWDHEWRRVPVDGGLNVLGGVGRGNATPALQRRERKPPQEPLHPAKEQRVSGLT